MLCVLLIIKLTNTCEHSLIYVYLKSLKGSQYYKNLFKVWNEVDKFVESSQLYPKQSMNNVSFFFLQETDFLVKISNEIFLIPLCLPRFFFQELQSTSIKVIMIPKKLFHKMYLCQVFVKLLLFLNHLVDCLI